MAMEERVSPGRGKEVKRKGYTNQRFLKGFQVVMKGRQVKYTLKDLGETT